MIIPPHVSFYRPSMVQGQTSGRSQWRYTSSASHRELCAVLNQIISRVVQI